MSVSSFLVNRIGVRESPSRSRYLLPEGADAVGMRGGMTDSYVWIPIPGNDSLIRTTGNNVSRELLREVLR